MSRESPDEIITIVQCQSCGKVSLPREMVVEDETKMHGQMYCPECRTRLNAESFYDYASLEVATYHE